MYMSVEMITMLIGIVSILLALAGAFGWMIHRMDVLENRLEGKLGARIDAGDERLGARIDALDEKLGARIDAGDERLGARIDAGDERLGARIDALDEKLGARIDALDEKLGARIDKVADELVEVKIALARVEGPPRHLITAR
ncbi:response regulator [Microbacterium sp. KHB019]|uniref:response regulator n=1 Tax=Microbacterium sp. KHB019 TaxID=3129770 RepID=UPI0030B673A7